MRIFTLFISAAAFALSVLGALGSDAKPNVVWIIADDMSTDTAAYGAAGISTPNLDRLATEGRRYDRAYASAPVCSSSRSAFILGSYQTTTGLHPHDVENPQPLAAPYRHLPNLLRDAGWFVTNAPAPGGMRGGKLIKKAKTHYNFSHDPAVMYDGDDWRARNPGQPFFAQFQIPEPHRAFPIPDSFDEAAIAAIQLPANYPNHPLIKRDWYAYQRSVEMVDHRVGVILKQLEEEGELDNTIVIFFGDHGRPMPWGKQWLNVEGLQVPLLIRGPGIEKGSVETRLVSLIDLAPSVLELAGLPIPDWMEGRAILGSQFPEREVIFAARDRCGDAMDRIRAVIGEDHMLVKNYDTQISKLNWSSYKEGAYPGMPVLRFMNAEHQLDPLQASWLTPTRPEIEFFDLKVDPTGVRNVADDPAYRDIIATMRQQLDLQFQDATDKGASGDPATEPPLSEIQASKRQTYNRLWQKRMGNPEPSDAERVQWWEKEYRLDQPASDGAGSLKKEVAPKQ